MRKIISLIMLIAAAAMTFVSCQKEETQAPAESKSTTLTLNANVVDTKTYITEENAVLWGTGEYVQLYFNNGTDAPQFVKSNNTNADEWADSDQAMFSFDINYNQADSYNVGGVYPASVVADNNTDATAYKVILPAVQNASSTSYDPSAFIMIMKPVTIADADFDKEGHIASFRRATALNKITLTGVKEAINTVAITAEGKDLAGRRKFNLTTGEEGDIYYGQTGTITVNAAYTPGDIDVWFTSWGTEIAEGETLSVVLKSETKTYEKTITARAKGIKFVEGALNKLTIDMSSVEGVTSAVALPFVEDFETITSGNNTTSGGSGTAVTAGMMTQFSSYASATYQAGGAVRIGKSGNLTTKELDLSKDFHVIVSAKGWSSSELLLTVTAGSQVNDIELTTYMAGEFVDYIINFDAVDNSEVVKFTTTSTKRCFIDKIQILEGHTELPSILTADTPEIMAAAGGEGSFAYTLTNPKDGEELTATTDVDWITDITINDGNVSYTVAENTVEEAREATITLKYEGVEDVLVTVSQAAYVDPNAIYEVTVKEFNELTGTETATYELTGTVTGIYTAYSEDYNNISFFINDGTGEVLIFRMSCAQGINDPTAISAGDEITVQGKPTIYSNAIQMAAGGVCISHKDACEIPTISFADNTVTITAEDGATIYYTTDGTDPTEASDVYSDGIMVDESNSPMTVKAIAVAEGKVKSAVASKVCTYVDPNAGGEETIVDLTKWTLTTNAYDQAAKINGVSYSHVLKLGTSSKAGTATFTLPAGTTRLTYSAVSWKGTSSVSLKFTVNGSSYTQAVKANEGATGNPTYTITSADTDNYSLDISVDAETTVTLTTTSNKRVILWDIKAVVLN